MSILPGSDGGGRLRWLLLGSLVLNLLFVGAAGAVAIRYSSPVPLTAIAHIDHTFTGRLDRITTGLPDADAEILRAQVAEDATKIAAAHADLRLSQEDMRNSLRAEPFDADAMRAAMAENRNARANFDVTLHDMLASAAAKMSMVGRDKLADWPPERDNARPLR
jgi:uncharacterized membrane protein